MGFKNDHRPGCKTCGAQFRGDVIFCLDCEQWWHSTCQPRAARTLECSCRSHFCLTSSGAGVCLKCKEKSCSILCPACETSFLNSCLRNLLDSGLKKSTADLIKIEFGFVSPVSSIISFLELYVSEKLKLSGFCFIDETGQLEHLFWFMTRRIHKAGVCENILLFDFGTFISTQTRKLFKQFARDNVSRPSYPLILTSTVLRAKTKLLAWSKDTLLRAVQRRGSQCLKLSDIYSEYDNAFEDIYSLVQEERISIIGDAVGYCCVKFKKHPGALEAWLKALGQAGDVGAR